MADHHQLINSKNPDKTHHQDIHARGINPSPSRNRSRGSSRAQSSLQKVVHAISGNSNKIHTNSSFESSSSVSLSVINVSESDGHDEMAQMRPSLEKKALLDIDLNVIPPEVEIHQPSGSPVGNAGDEVIIVDEKSSSNESSSSVSLSVINVSESDGPDEMAQMGSDLEKKAVFDIDLNVTPPADETHQDSGYPVGNAGEVIIIDEKSTLTEECNESVQLETNPDEETSQREEKSRRLRRWEALLEVVRLVSGDGGSEPIDPMELMNSELTGLQVKENAEEGEGTSAAAAEEVSAAASPLVRTRSGRTQVLPYKYRDSVVEPTTSLPSRRNRSSSSSSFHVPTKRRTR